MLGDIYQSWGKRPPLHWMVAAYFGIGQGETDEGEEEGTPPPPPDPEALKALWDTYGAK